MNFNVKRGIKYLCVAALIWGTLMFLVGSFLIPENNDGIVVAFVMLSAVSGAVVGSLAWAKGAWG